MLSSTCENLKIICCTPTVRLLGQVCHQGWAWLVANRVVGVAVNNAVLFCELEYFAIRHYPMYAVQCTGAIHKSSLQGADVCELDPAATQVENIVLLTVSF